MLATVLLVTPAPPAIAQETPPPPPPEPSKTSMIGQQITNPITDQTTTVSALRRDPVGTPTVDDVAFVGVMQA